MAIKKRKYIQETNKSIEDLADQLADKPYGEIKEDNTLIRTTISLPTSVLFAIEDMAKSNKRKNKDLKSVSAIIRDCVAKSLSLY